MKEQIITIKENALHDIEAAADAKQLEDVRVKYLSKKSELILAAKGISKLPQEERPVIGGLINETKTELEKLIGEKEKLFEEEELQRKLEEGKIDITLPSTKIKRGSKHPMTRTIEIAEDIFVSMGYEVIPGPELETDEYCFERLNIPKGHPARDMQDTFYLDTEHLLRTHTSAMQGRIMDANTEKTPFKAVYLGKTYRRDDDATHSHQFNQIEPLVIGEGISIADMRGTIEIFVKKLLGENLQIRLRPSYFPFTEPSYEVDVSCFKCGGKGCNLCKQTGWIEILGCGMVHPNVLRDGGYDPEKYSGFAIGMGLDRLAMFKYDIPDIRLLYQNDVRFLNEFDKCDRN